MQLFPLCSYLLLQFRNTLFSQVDRLTDSRLRGGLPAQTFQLFLLLLQLDKPGCSDSTQLPLQEFGLFNSICCNRSYSACGRVTPIEEGRYLHSGESST